MFLHSTNNNKETFRLLDMSSGTDSDILQIEIAQPKRKRVHRKHRPRPGASGPAVDGSRSLTVDSSLARRVSFLVAAAAAFVWLLVLTWLAAALHSQLSTIDHTVNSPLTPLTVIAWKSTKVKSEVKAKEEHEGVRERGESGAIGAQGMEAAPARGGAGGAGGAAACKKMRKRRELDALVAPAPRRSRDALLSPSSDEAEAEGRRPLEEAWLRVRRRGRRAAPCAAAARACSLLLVAACLLAAAAVLWLFVDVRAQIDELRAEMDKVSLSSQGVGDALQRCHSAARDLRNNHTELASRLDRLAARQDNITHQLAQMQLGLTAVQQRLAGSSELTTAELGKSVARFGSQISDLDTRAQALKDQATAALTQQNSLTKELEDIKAQIEKLSNTSVSSVAESSKRDLEPIINKQTEIATILTDLGRNVTSINETLATKISWATVDISKNKNFISSLQESLQNNSASLSSLQTAWKDSNDVLTKNITILSSDMSTKLEDYYKQLSELKQSHVPLNKASPMIVPEEVTKIQNLSMILNDTKPVPDTEAIKSLHERDSSDVVPKLWSETNTTVQPQISSKGVKSATGKPNILSGSGNK